MNEIIKPLEWLGGRAATPFGDYSISQRDCGQCPQPYAQLYFAGQLLEERHGALESELQGLADAHYRGLAAMVLQPDALATLVAFTVAECRSSLQAAMMSHPSLDKAYKLVGLKLDELVPDDFVVAWRAQRRVIYQMAIEAARDSLFMLSPAKGGGWLVGKTVHTDPRNAVRAAIDIMRAK